MSFRILLLFATVLLSSIRIPVHAESGHFRLYKVEQAIGDENYTIDRDGDKLNLQADFAFTDRGTKVPLTGSLRTLLNYTPQTFNIAGSTSRSSSIEASVSVEGTRVKIREGNNTRDMVVPRQFFAISGYAPISFEMALMRFWRLHGAPTRLAILPSGEVEISDRGQETVFINSQPVKLERYIVRGLVWGLETLWMDRDNNLAAVVTRDAEFDHFEALRDGYETILPIFVQRSARDEMAELQELSRTLPGRQVGPLAFTGATLIDGTGRTPVPNAVLFTQHGKIVACGPASSIIVPRNTKRINISGKYVIPGLWDMHAHYEQVEWGPIYLAAGVTTARDVGNEFEFIRTVRDMVNSGLGLGPRLLVAGILDGKGPLAIGITRVNSPDDASKWVKTYHDSDFQQIKIYSSVAPENVKAIAVDAHALGMTVTGHIPIGMTIYDGVRDGMDQVNHIIYAAYALLPKGYDPYSVPWSERPKALAAIDVDGQAGRDLIEFLKTHETVIDPTLVIFELMLHPPNQPVSQIEPEVEHVATELKEQLMTGGVAPEDTAAAKATFANLLAIVTALHRVGVPIVTGTDQGVPGYSLYRELELYVQAGFTPMEALQAANIVPARIMKADADSGTVEAGKRADFAILDANPLADIHNIRSVRSVVANGILYDSGS